MVSGECLILGGGILMEDHAHFDVCDFHLKAGWELSPLSEQFFQSNSFRAILSTWPRADHKHFVLGEVASIEPKPFPCQIWFADVSLVAIVMFQDTQFKMSCSQQSGDFPVPIEIQLNRVWTLMTAGSFFPNICKIQEPKSSTSAPRPRIQRADSGRCPTRL